MLKRFVMAWLVVLGFAVGAFADYTEEDAIWWMTGACNYYVYVDETVYPAADTRHDAANARWWHVYVRYQVWPTPTWKTNHGSPAYITDRLELSDPLDEDGYIGRAYVELLATQPHMNAAFNHLVTAGAYFDAEDWNACVLYCQAAIDEIRYAHDHCDVANEKLESAEVIVGIAPGVNGEILIYMHAVCEHEPHCCGDTH